ALIAAGSTGHAADLGRPVYKTPPVAAPVVPAFSFTGCFIGGNAGWAWGKQDVHERAQFSNGSVFTGSKTLDTSGAIFGGQIGCDYQFATNFVVGIQGDLVGADLSGDAADPLSVFTGFGAGQIHLRTEWIAKVT